MNPQPASPPLLIVSNGAFKSGSTWLFNILRELTACPPPPPEYTKAGWGNPSIAPDRLADLLAHMDAHGGRYLSKNHLRKPAQRDLLLSRPYVRVLDIERDIRDVVVSAYYHDRRKKGYTGAFDRYFVERGYKKARFVTRYHELWAVGSPQVYCASYERLHSDFDAEVARIAAFVGVALDPPTLERVRQATTLDALRESYGEQDKAERFFRKGITGDWQNHFTPALLAELDRTLSGGVPRRGWLIRLRSRLRRRLKRTLRR